VTSPDRTVLRALSLTMMVFVAVACAAQMREAPADTASPIAAAVAHEARPAADREREVNRDPRGVLEFAGLQPGMRVLDLAAGGGYYSEIIANVVGAEGHVTLHNPPWLVAKFGDMGIPERLQKPNMANVRYLEAPLEALELEPNSIDVAMIVLFYHDTYWQKTDRAAMNKGVLSALAPGGRFIVIDHHAEAGSGARDVETIHRIDVEEVKRDVLAAGFELESESAVLRHPEDDRSKGVFSPGTRGQTDRFVLRFWKPAPQAK
jgi:predicted methyltransferase